MERALKTGSLNWDNLSFKDKAQLFDGWAFVGFAGNLFLIFGSLFYIFSDVVTAFDAELLVGLGTFFIWIRTVKFFTGNHPYDLFTRTL